MQEIGVAGYRAARLFVAAMNIGSAGFWWWEIPFAKELYTSRRLTISDSRIAPKGVGFDFPHAQRYSSALLPEMIR